MTTFYISTKLKRGVEVVSDLMEFTVTASVDVGDGDETRAVASLDGFLIRRIAGLDQLPFNDFDDRSAHVTEGYEVLTEKQQEICSALKIEQDDLEYVDSIIFCEKLVVDPEYRKNKLALRLLRDPIWAFGNLSSLMILKAHPDGKGIEDDDCRKLADYYCSDKSLKFEELDRKNLAGWLVSKGAWNACESDDEWSYYSIG